jgi:retron-type reverse transcriptase
MRLLKKKFNQFQQDLKLEPTIGFQSKESIFLLRKPGKTTLRPLGLPDFTDKVVQNSILLILTAIYEPEFEYSNANFRFRPNKGCNNAIRMIRRQGQASEWALEGDIKGAYDNINHEILIQIFKKRIKDQDFLDFIYKGLKSGLMVDQVKFDSILPPE